MDYESIEYQCRLIIDAAKELSDKAFFEAFEASDYYGDIKRHELESYLIEHAQDVSACCSTEQELRFWFDYKRERVESALESEATSCVECVNNGTEFDFKPPTQTIQMIDENICEVSFSCGCGHQWSEWYGMKRIAKN